MARTGRPPTAPEKRFWPKVAKSANCWLWTGAPDKDGYGEFWAQYAGAYRKIRAHRFSYILAYGSISPNLCVLHKCDTPACVRPDHLFVGTLLDNNHDRCVKQRQTRGSAVNTARLSETDVVTIRQRVASGETQSEVSKDYKLLSGHITKIVNRHIWKHI